MHKLLYHPNYRTRIFSSPLMNCALAMVCNTFMHYLRCWPSTLKIISILGIKLFGIPNSVHRQSKWLTVLLSIFVLGQLQPSSTNIHHDNLFGTSPSGLCCWVENCVPVYCHGYLQTNVVHLKTGVYLQPSQAHAHGHTHVVFISRMARFIKLSFTRLMMLSFAKAQVRGCSIIRPLSLAFW